MLNYLAYGSNLHPVRLQKRLPSANLLGTTSLHGYALRFCKRGADGSGKATLVHNANAAVWVAAYQIPEAEAQELDRIEGLGRGYDRQLIEVPCFGTCFTYIAPSVYRDEALSPYTWYRDLVLAGCDYHEFPAGYRELIATHPANRDPDSARRAVNAEILATALQNMR